MEQHTRADTIGVFLTGGAVDMAPEVVIDEVGLLAPPFKFTTPSEVDPDDSLGGWRAPTCIRQIGWLPRGNLRGIYIERISGANAEGIGVIEAVDNNSLRWTSPDGTAGESAEITDGETKLLESGGEPGKYIVITRNTADNLQGTLEVKLLPIYNNVIGSSNVSSAERSTGETKLRCVAFVNKHSTDKITNLKIWIGTLATQQVSDAGQLGASGAGVIKTTGSFADWPASGFCRIITFGASLREIVYYSRRTDAELFVPAQGRGLLETAPGAGAADDTLDAVPGIKIGKESSDPVTGKFSQAANENDISAVSGLSWTTGTTEDTGLLIDEMIADEQVGIWIWLRVIDQQIVAADLENYLKWKFTADETDYTNEARGHFRIENSNSERYELFRGLNGEPDFSVPWEIFNSLPYTSSDVRYGDEMVVNGRFEFHTDWVKGAGWNFDDGDKAYWDKTQGSENLEQAIDIEAGHTYQVSYRVSAFEGGASIKARIGGVDGAVRSSSGTYSEQITAADTSGLKFVPSGGAGAYFELKWAAVKDTVTTAGTYYFVTRKRNGYGLVGLNIDSWKVKVGADGAQEENPPEGPRLVVLTSAVDAKVKVDAVYYYDRADVDAATHWLIYLRDDGTDPDPELDTPTVVSMKKMGYYAILSWVSDAFNEGDTVKVLVRTRRIEGENNYDSTNTDIHSTIATTEGPTGTPKARAYHGETAEVIA